MKAARYRLTKEVQTDLLGIRTYTIEHWGKSQCQSYLNGLNETLNTLCDMPSIGVLAQDIADDLHRAPYASHMIYYVEERDQLTVLAILQKNMVPERHLHARTQET